MIINEMLGVSPGEKPLDQLILNGGFCGIFRTIACIGDSLSSGEFESLDQEDKVEYHDYFEYSWGQYMARNIGATVYNFSRGGMTAIEYCENFASQMGFWNMRLAAQAYIIALGVNDMNHLERYENGFGKMTDVDFDNEEKKRKTSAILYGVPQRKLYGGILFGDSDGKRLGNVSYRSTAWKNNLYTG